MERVLESVKKEIRQIGEQGLNASNLEVLYKLIDIEKDIYEVKEKEKECEGGAEMMGYMDGGYGARGGRGGGYRGYDDYGRGGYGRGGYRGGYDDRISQHLDRIMEGADAYQYGRDSYRDGGSQERMKDGLERLMYAVCMFVESMSEFAETPEEKEIIRKHVQKIKAM